MEIIYLLIFFYTTTPSGSTETAYYAGEFPTEEMCITMGDLAIEALKERGDKKQYSCEPVVTITPQNGE